MSKTAGKKLNNWEFSFAKMANSNLPEPLGFSIADGESQDVKNKKLEINEMKKSKAWDLIKGQGSSIFTTFISSFFMGRNLSLFIIFIYGYYCYNSISAIVNVNKAFKAFESPDQSLLMYKVLYVIASICSFGMILYRIYGMGLIPLNASDWVSIAETSIPTSEMLLFR